MKQCIVITYKSGMLVSIDIPEFYYELTRRRGSRYSPHDLFLKHYRRFVKELNKKHEFVDVHRFFDFSNTTVSGVDILSVDIIDLDTSSQHLTRTYVPSIHDNIVLDISSTRFEELASKLIRFLDFADNHKLLQSMIDSSTAESSPKKTTRKKSTKQDKKETITKLD